jgi:hypothetical protein
VDEGQPETQPPGFLGVCGKKEREWGLVYTTCHVTELHRIWRPSGIEGFFYFNLKC